MCAERSRRESGFSMVELAVTLVLTTTLLYALHSTLLSSMQGRRAGDRLQLVHDLACDYVERMRNIPFGRAADPRASGAQLDELFDDDDDLGSTTLHAISVAASDAGHTFSVATQGLRGTFRVRVSGDLNGNGVIDGVREGRADLLGVQIFFDDVLVQRTFIAADPELTSIDTHIDYLSGG